MGRGSRGVAPPTSAAGPVACPRRARPRSLLRLSMAKLPRSSDTARSPPADQAPGSRDLAMAFKLIEAAQDRWRAVNGPHLAALIRAGARFEKGVIVEREQQDQEAVA